MDEVDKSCVAPEHVRDGNVMAAEHNNLARGQKDFIFPGDLPDADSVRHCLQGHFGALIERFQHVKVVTPVHDSDNAVRVQHHSPFFGTIQKV